MPVSACRQPLRHLRDAPQICRDYSTDNCEYEDDWVYEKYFETPEQVEEYVDAVLPREKGHSFRSRRPPLLPIIG